VTPSALAAQGVIARPTVPGTCLAPRLPTDTSGRRLIPLSAAARRLR
jgi:hypothetical protein